MRKFGVNTIVYQKMMSAGTKQVKLLSHIKENGGTIAEVRREFLSREELADLAAEARRLGLTLYYSVPEEIFKAGRLNLDMLEQIAREALELEARCVKLSLGNFQDVAAEEVKKLAAFTAEKPFDVLIENGPQGAAGDAALLLRFFRCQDEIGGTVGLTFDTGNFASAGFDPLQCARDLNGWTRWIHLKDEKNGRITMLQEGAVDFDRILPLFRADTPAAIEYPCASLEQAAEEMKKALALI